MRRHYTSTMGGGKVHTDRHKRRRYVSWQPMRAGLNLAFHHVSRKGHEPVHHPREGARSTVHQRRELLTPRPSGCRKPAPDFIAHEPRNVAGALAR
jgi:hypothetical protein